MKDKESRCKKCEIEIPIDHNLWGNPSRLCKRCFNDRRNAKLKKYPELRNNHTLSSKLSRKRYKQSKKGKDAESRHVSKLIPKLRLRIRQRLCMAIINNCKKGSAVSDLGCSIEFFKQYLESLFQPGMTWENWSMHGWHIDHKIPLASFDLTDREQFLKACHYSNLQPLWASDNLRKGAKIL